MAAAMLLEGEAMSALQAMAIAITISVCVSTISLRV